MSISRIERLKRELQSAVSQGDLELALAVTDDMVDTDPEDSRNHTSRGVILAKLSRIEEALEELDEAIGIDNEDEKAWYSKGCILMDSGRARPALACFYKSLDLDPGQEKARERFLKCLKMMQDLLKGDDEDPTLFYEGPTLIREDEDGNPVQEDDASSWRTMIDGTGGTVEKAHVPVFERPPLPEEEPDIFDEDPKRRSILDDDMFEGPQDDFEDWDDEDEAQEEDDGVDWSEDGEEDWTGDDEPIGTVKCRCGSDIPIYSQERPYRFECPGCGRTGTLK